MINIRILASIYILERRQSTVYETFQGPIFFQYLLSSTNKVLSSLDLDILGIFTSCLVGDLRKGRELAEVSFPKIGHAEDHMSAFESGDQSRGRVNVCGDKLGAF
jgi:hypothetical protein